MNIQKDITIKNVALHEMDSVIDVEQKVWPSTMQADLGRFTSRIKIFPEGFLGAYLDSGILAGVCTSMILPEIEIENITWQIITGNGYCSNHSATGTDLYIVSLGVLPGFQNRLIGSLLIKAQVELARRRGLGKVIVGARCPGYHLNKNLTIADYLAENNDKHERLDYGIRFYERLGFTIDKVISNFMHDDDESCNYGVKMILENKTNPI